MSKFLSLHLRHRPEELGLHLEPGGWVFVDDLLAGAHSAGVHLTREELAVVVRRSDKQRFAFDESGERIRANQGHSVPIDLQMTPTAPPAVLYHGTAERFIAAILAEGLKKMKRHHVHLSPDIATARRVGARRGRALILSVDSGPMNANGVEFFCSANGVWLTDRVPPEYLRVLDETAEG